jgi:hypothetical protein
LAAPLLTSAAFWTKPPATFATSHILTSILLPTVIAASAFYNHIYLPPVCHKFSQINVLMATQPESIISGKQTSKMPFVTCTCGYLLRMQFKFF